MTEQELYNEFFSWIDTLATIKIPAIGQMEERIILLSDLMCESVIGHYTDELFEEWRKKHVDAKEYTQ